MEKSEFNLTEFKKKYGFEPSARSIEISKRDQAIRDMLHRQEQFKMNTIEGYEYDLYGIISYDILHLLKKYHLTKQYETDKNSVDFLLPKNNIDDNNKN